MGNNVSCNEEFDLAGLKVQGHLVTWVSLGSTWLPGSVVGGAARVATSLQYTMSSLYALFYTDMLFVPQ